MLKLMLFALLLVCDDKPKTAKEALAPFNEFVGVWNAKGEPESGTPAEKQKGMWKESVSWSWKFKGADAWIVFEINNGKHYRGGEIRWLGDADLFEVKLLPKQASAEPLVFKGKLAANGRSLTAERTDEKNETQRLTIALIGEVRSSYRLERRLAGRTNFIKDFKVEATREGEALAGAQKSNKPECVVSGGLGTMAVSYKGKTYYVCCTGCRDAFNEDPEKYIKEYEEKKRKGK
jgi:hypothetical protein